MSKKKKSYNAEFKTKVVLELLREEESAAVDNNFNRLHSALDYDKPMNVYMPALRKEA